MKSEFLIADCYINQCQCDCNADHKVDLEDISIYKIQVDKKDCFILKSACGGFCGDQAPDGCWCDSLCKNYGDCCPDYDRECGDESCYSKCDEYDSLWPL